MAIRIAGSTVIDNNENLDIDGNADIDGNTAIGGGLAVTGDSIIGAGADPAGLIVTGNLTLGTDIDSFHHIKGKVYLESNIDATANAQSGTLIIGSNTGDNIGIDGNEIQARNGNNVDTLHIQNEGGELKVGGTADIANMKGRGFARPFSMKMGGDDFDFEQQDGAWKLLSDAEAYWVTEFDGTVEAGYGCQNDGYKVPEDGIYQFGFNLNTTDMSGNHDSLNIKMDGSSYQSRTWDHDLNDMYDISGMETGDTEGHTFQGQCLLRCDRGDVIKLYYTTHNSGTGHINVGMSSNFWGMLVAPGNGQESQVSEGGH